MLRRASHLGQAEVQNLGVAARGDKDVGRLDIAMDDPGGVRGVQGVSNLHADRQQRLDVETATIGYARLQRGALQILHGDEGAAVLFADVMNRADVGMIQRRRGPGLALKAVHGLAVPSQFVGHELERDEAMEPRVFRFVDDAHAAATELLDDAIVGDRLPHGSAVACRQVIGLVAGHFFGGDLNRRSRQERASRPR